MNDVLTLSHVRQPHALAPDSNLIESASCPIKISIMDGPDFEHVVKPQLYNKPTRKDEWIGSNKEHYALQTKTPHASEKFTSLGI